VYYMSKEDHARMMHDIVLWDEGPLRNSKFYRGSKPANEVRCSHYFKPDMRSMFPPPGAPRPKFILVWLMPLIFGKEVHEAPNTE